MQKKIKFSLGLAYYFIKETNLKETLFRVTKIIQCETACAVSIDFKSAFTQHCRPVFNLKIKFKSSTLCKSRVFRSQKSLPRKS